MQIDITHIYMDNRKTNCELTIEEIKHKFRTDTPLDAPLRKKLEEHVWGMAICPPNL